MSTVTDWRGVEITPGALVIHSGTSGYSASITEAHVADDMLTRSGKVRLVAVRASRGGAWRYAVNGLSVEPQFLTVVTELPLSPAATTDDLRRSLHEAINRRVL